MNKYLIGFLIKCQKVLLQAISIANHVFVVLLKIRLNLILKYLAGWFGIHVSRISQILLIVFPGEMACKRNLLKNTAHH